MSNTLLKKNGVVVISGTDGHTVISRESPLTRLHYFDGKFLRASDLNLEQRAFLNQVRLSNQAGGSGLVRGFSCTLSGGDRLDVSPGLAIDPAGRILNLPEDIRVAIPELIEKSLADTMKSGIAAATADGVPAFEDCELVAQEAPDTILKGVRLYLVTVGHAEAYCGEEDVYGKLCEEACISDTERPYVIEGIVIRAVPLDLPAFLPNSKEIALSSRHLRSRVASAYFAAERSNPASLISGEGLSSPIWCLGAEAEGGASIPLAVIAWDGTRALFLDSWIARREKMETPPCRYWAGRMAMRPWNVFLAQVLQFQCQLAQSLSDGVDSGGGDDPCEEERLLAGLASEAIGSLLEQYATIAKRFTRQEALASQIGQIDLAAVQTLRKDLAGIAARVVDSRFLINRGIVELPSAGYLPVTPGDEVAVNEQVRRLTGEGVNLSFCVVRPDFVPHALEEARHMDRISLLEGIDDPSAKPQVDVLVPDGRVEEYTPRPEGIGYEMELGADVFSFLAGIASVSTGSDTVSKLNMANMTSAGSYVAMATGDNTLQTMLSKVIVRGAARGESTDGGGHALYFAGRTPEEADTGIARSFQIDSSVLKVAKVFQKASSGFGLFQAAETAASVKKEDGTEESASAAAVSEISVDKIAIENVLRYKRVIDGLRIDVPAGKKPFHAVWIELRTDLDPFSLERGGTSPVSAGTCLVASLEIDDKSAIFVMEGSCTGWLHIENKTRQGADTSLVCRFKAHYTPTITFISEDNRRSIPLSVKLNEKVFIVRREGTGSRPAVFVNVPDPSPWRRLGSTELVMNRQWDGDGEKASSLGYIQLSSARVESAEVDSLKKEVTGAVVERVVIDDSSYSRSVGKFPSNSIPLFSARQKQNDDVLLPENNLHGASLSALAVLEAALEEKNFADFAARQLFPPPKTVPDQLKVYARRDWVLFHRRRRISCGYDVFPDPLVKPRRFKVFNISVQETDVLAIRQAFLENQSAVLGRYEPIPLVATVEYEAGIQSLRTDADDIRTEWLSKVGKDVDIRLAMIATRGAAYDEGPDLARARLNSLVEALSSAVELDEDAELLYASRMPDLFAQGEIDGVVLFVTLKVQTVCHHVYRFEYEAKLLNRFFEVLKKGEGKEVDILLEAGGKKIDYTPFFKNGTGEFHGQTTPEDLQKAWGDAGDDTPYRAFTMVPGTSEDQPYDLQARKIASALGADIDNAVVMGIGQSVAGCPAITVLATEPPGQPVVNDVISWSIRVSSDSGVLEKLQEMVQGRGLSVALADGNWGLIGRVEFDPSNVVDASSLNDAVKAAIEKNILDSDGGPFAGQSYRILSVTRKGQTDDVARNKAQAEKIAAAMNISEDVATAVDGSDQWPVAGDGSSITCIVVLVVLRRETAGKNIYATHENAPSDVVTNVTEEISFDKFGKVIRDLAFDTAVRKLKEDGVILKSIELVTISSQPSTPSESRAESLLAALKEAGVAATSAKATLRFPSSLERRLVSSFGPGVTSGLVLRK